MIIIKIKIEKINLVLIENRINRKLRQTKHQESKRPKKEEVKIKLKIFLQKSQKKKKE